MKKKLLMTMIMVLGISAAAFAQDGPPPGGAMGGPGMHGEEARGRRGEIAEKLRSKAETMMVLFLADEMELPADKEDRLIGAVRRHLKENRELENKSRALEQDLKKKLDAKAGDSKGLEEKLKAIETLREEQKESRENLEKNLEEFLTVEERAKFVVSWPKAQREVMEQFEKMRQKRGMGGNADGPAGKNKDENPAVPPQGGKNKSKK